MKRFVFAVIACFVFAKAAEAAILCIGNPGITQKVADYTATVDDCREGGGHFIDFNSSSNLTLYIPDGGILTISGCQIDFGMRGGGILTVSASDAWTSIVESGVTFSSAGGSVIEYESGAFHVLGGI